MDEELRAVLTYIERIQNYEKRGYRNFSALISIVWGFLLFFAGVMDYYTYLVGDALFHFLPWVISSFEGILFTIIVRNGIQRAFFADPLDKEMASEKENAGKKVAWTTTLMVTVIWIGVFSLLAFNLFFLIIPYVSLMVGLIMLLNVHVGHTSPKIRRLAFLNAGIVILTSVSILILFAFTEMRFVQFYGVIAGTVIGITFVAFGLYYSQFDE